MIFPGITGIIKNETLCNFALRQVFLMALKQLTLRLEEEDYEKAVYWAKKHEMSLSEYLKAAIDLKIRWDNQDYDLPPLEIQRLNQLTDLIVSLSENQKSLEAIIVSRFDSFLNLARGEAYLEE